RVADDAVVVRPDEARLAELGEHTPDLTEAPGHPVVQAQVLEHVPGIDHVGLTVLVRELPHIGNHVGLCDRVRVDVYPREVRLAHLVPAPEVEIERRSHSLLQHPTWLAPPERCLTSVCVW